MWWGCPSAWLSIVSICPFSQNPCEPAGLFQSSLMAGWRSQGELSYVCHENWLLLREGPTQLFVKGSTGWIQLLVPCPWQQPGGWWICTHSSGNLDTGYWNNMCCLLPVEGCSKGHRAAGLLPCKGKGMKDAVLWISQLSPCLHFTEQHLHL